MYSSKIVAVVGIAILLVNSGHSASINLNCICTREYQPICGSDNTTYYNDCMFHCAKQRNTTLKIKYIGECGAENESVCACNLDYSPVCGFDSLKRSERTFPNLCTLRCEGEKNENLIVKHPGECA